MLTDGNLLAGSDLAQRWFNIVKSPILNKAGQALMYVSVYRDITKLKESEKLIAYQQRQILTSARLSALGEMAGGIAHEINNPLAIISGRSMNIRRVMQLKPVNKDLRQGECMRDHLRRISALLHTPRKSRHINYFQTSGIH